MSETDTRPRATYKAATPGCHCRIVGPKTKDYRWTKRHEEYRGMVGTWEDVLDKGWVGIYFHDLKRGEIFLPDWLIIEKEGTGFTPGI